MIIISFMGGVGEGRFEGDRVEGPEIEPEVLKKWPTPDEKDYQSFMEQAGADLCQAQAKLILFGQKKNYVSNKIFE